MLACFRKGPEGRAQATGEPTAGGKLKRMAGRLLVASSCEWRAEGALTPTVHQLRSAQPSAVDSGHALGLPCGMRTRRPRAQQLQQAPQRTTHAAQEASQ